MRLKQQPLHTQISFCRTGTFFDGQKLNVFPPIKGKAHSVQVWWIGAAAHTCFTNKRKCPRMFCGLQWAWPHPQRQQEWPNSYAKMHQHKVSYLSASVLLTSLATTSKIVIYMSPKNCRKGCAYLYWDLLRPGVWLFFSAWYNYPCGVWLKIPSATVCWPIYNTQRNTFNKQSHIPTVVHWS